MTAEALRQNIADGALDLRLSVLYGEDGVKNARRAENDADTAENDEAARDSDYYRKAGFLFFHE